MTKKKNALDLSAEVLANGAVREQGHKERLERYSKAKQHQVDVANHIKQHEPDLNKEYCALEECSRLLIFRKFTEADRYLLIGGCTCKKHLICAMCALRRSAKTVRAVALKIEAVRLENPELIPALITFTVKNNDSLEERYDHITEAKKKLLQARRTAMKARVKNKSVSRLIHGSFGSYEFKKGKGGHGWHPHSHEIALLDPSVEFQTVIKKGKEVDCPIEFEQALQQEWLKLTGDSHQVDVRKVKFIDKIEDGITPAEDSGSRYHDDGLMKAICEASKYALKLNDKDEYHFDDQIHAYRVLRGRRLTFTYGSMWGIKIPEDLYDDIHEEMKKLGPYIDLIYGFYDGKYRCVGETDTEDLLVGSSSNKFKKQKTRMKHAYTPCNKAVAAAMSNMPDWIEEKRMEGDI